MEFDIPLIAQADIERWVGSASFQRGSSYYQRGMIYSLHALQDELNRAGLLAEEFLR